MAKDAYRFIVPLIPALLITGWLDLKILFVCVTILLIFVAFFFRDPERKIPSGKGVIVSPADGTVVAVSTDDPNHGLTQLSIFLSIFNVHVNRSPIEGQVLAAEYKTGKFKAAFKPSASYENEQNVLTISNGSYTVTVKQIAGVIARRIVCTKRAGEPVRRGERIGLIRFGSRVDLILPKEVELKAKPRDRVKGGESIIGIYRE